MRALFTTLLVAKGGLMRTTPEALNHAKQRPAVGSKAPNNNGAQNSSPDHNTADNNKRLALTWLCIALFVLAGAWTLVPSRPSEVSDVKLNDSYTYSGELLDGKPQGMGTLVDAQGNRYEGEFKDGAFNGKGKFFSAEGWTYEGGFVNGKAQGEGTLTLEDGSTHKATFEGGVLK